MQKVRLSVHTADVDVALGIVQRVSAVEFIPTEMGDMREIRLSFPYAELLPRIQHAVQFLEVYAPKVGLWRTLREGSRTDLTEKDIKKRIQNTDVMLPLVEDFETLQVEFAEVTEKKRLLEEQHDLLLVWKKLPIKLSKLNTKRTKTLLVEKHFSTKEVDSLKQLLETALLEKSIPNLITEVSDNAVAVTLVKDNELISQVEKLIASLNAEVITPPQGEETPDVEFVAVSDKLAKVKNELALLHDQAEHFAMTHIKPLQIAGEILSWQKARFDIVHDAGATRYTVVFDGWLNESKREAIEAEFERQNVAAMFIERALDKDEQPPVDIVNSPFVQPFEAVTRLYGMPGYRDLDPTVFLAGFFFLFFGLSLTDVGYGLFLMVASAVILTWFKVTQPIRLFAKLLLFVGFATVLVGALFGGYLGIDPKLLPESLKAIQMFDPIGNPLPVFYLALGLGVFQVMVGMLVKIYSDHKQGRLVEGVMDQGPWLLVFSLALLYLATSLEYVSFLSLGQITNLIYVGIVLIILSSGRKGETIFAKIKDALSGLYSSIGYFSDILSYSRLLALGLATTALAFAVNMIAGMVFDKESYITYVIAGIILIIGHLFTLAVNTLGAFIHSARLQFVEFFGKFIAGTGKEFAPLSRTEKHLTIVDD